MHLLSKNIFMVFVYECTSDWVLLDKYATWQAVVVKGS